MSGRPRRVVWVGAFVGPVLVSACVWLVAAALEPLVFPVMVLAVGSWAVCWDRPWLLRISRGLRSPSGNARALVGRALVLVTELRGRGEPRVWLVRRPGFDVAALTGRDLMVSQGVIVALSRAQGHDRVVAALAAHALGRRRAVWCPRLLAAARAFCLPASLLSALASPVRWLLAGWGGRVLFGVVWVIAVAQSIEAGRLPVAGGLVLLASGLALGAWRSRVLEARLDRAGDDLVIANGLGPELARTLPDGPATGAEVDRRIRLTQVGRPSTEDAGPQAG